jgi:ABC-type nickel/cobalt efflux system permease component RcnA
MGTIIGALVAKGLSEKVARAIAYAGLALVIILAMWGGKRAYDRSVIAHHEATIARKAAKATDQAATERAADTIANAKHQQELHDAIHSVPDAPPAGPSHALACKRLHDLGRDPPACR